MSEVLEAKDGKVSFPVKVLENGVIRTLEVRLQEKIAEVLKAAIALFGIVSNPHTYSLFTTAGVELKDTETVQDAHLKREEELILRPSAVKGG